MLYSTYMTNRFLYAVALIVAACSSPTDPEPSVAYKQMTIPANHCGILESADGVNAIQIGGTPDELGPTGCAPKDVGVKGCRIEDTDVEFIVSSDFTFYSRNATLEIYDAEYCWTQGK